MALASTGWDDYPASGFASPATESVRTRFNMLVAGGLLAACVAATMPLLHVFDGSRLDAPGGSSVTAGHGGTFVPSSRSWLQESAESFLLDSLSLTRRCQTNCAPTTSQIAEAKELGRLSPLEFPLAGLPVQRRFGMQIAPDLPATAADPAPVRVGPSVVVPLAPASFRSAPLPVPAPRLERPGTNAAALAAMDGPMTQASLPSDTRVAPAMSGPVIGRSDGVAIYDISAATVFLPNGERLEAHSGLGYMVDNPRYADKKNTGPTPPNTYNLVRLEGRFHGVEALRLVPVDGYNKYGRDGLLTHTYLLRGRPAQSNGCVVFPDYARFLEAFKRGYIRRLVVVPRLSDSPLRIASAGDGK